MRLLFTFRIVCYRSRNTCAARLLLHLSRCRLRQRLPAANPASRGWRYVARLLANLLAKLLAEERLLLVAGYAGRTPDGETHTLSIDATLRAWDYIPVAMRNSLCAPACWLARSARASPPFAARPTFWRNAGRAAISLLLMKLIQLLYYLSRICLGWRCGRAARRPGHIRACRAGKGALACHAGRPTPRNSSAIPHSSA